MAIVRVEVFKDKAAADFQKAKLQVKGFFVSGPEAVDEVGWDATAADGNADNVAGATGNLWVIFAKK